MDLIEKRKLLKQKEEELAKAKKDFAFFKAMQLALKTVINGTYGAFCNKNFVLFNENIANAITAMGRDIIQYIFMSIEDYYYNHWHNDIETHRKLGKYYIGKDEKNIYYTLDIDYKIVGWGFKPTDKSTGLQRLAHDLCVKKEKLKEISETKEIDGKNIKIEYYYEFFNIDKVIPIDGSYSDKPMPTWCDDFKISQYFRNKPLGIYIDTDSVDNQSVTITDKYKSTVEELYNRNIKNGSAGNTLTGHESVITDEKILNYDKNKGLYYAPIKRIIRHKVTKAKWKIKTKSGKEVIITGDHSCIVFRNGEQITIKPKDILKTDKILSIFNNMNYQIEELESCEQIGYFEDEYVYDIEVDDDTHTFIANDILVHNSNYISFDPVMESINFEGDQLEFILHLNRFHQRNLNNNFLDVYAKRYKVKNIQDFELETISESILFIAKKNYLKNVVFEDGVFYDSMTHYSPTGVEIVKSSTPPFVRANIWEFINYIFKNSKELNMRNIQRIVNKLKEEFKMANIEDISITTSCTNYKTKCLNDTSGLEFAKPCHFAVKASAFHNYLLNKNHELKAKYDLIKGARVKYFYCQHPVSEYFAYVRSFYPYELIEKEKVIIDYDTQFEKCVLQIVNRFLEPLNMPHLNKRLGFIQSLFNSSDFGEDAPAPVKKKLEFYGEDENDDEI